MHRVIRLFMPAIIKQSHFLSNGNADHFKHPTNYLMVKKYIAALLKQAKEVGLLEHNDQYY